MNIRKRAVGSFQEWEMLDRAVSGRREPLGMHASFDATLLITDELLRHKALPDDPEGNNQAPAGSNESAQEV
jgi:hypothetical protein